MSKQLRVERRHDDAVPLFGLPFRETLEQMLEMRGVIRRALEGDAGLVGTLGAQVYVRTAHLPELEAAGPADLVELEVRLVARVPLVPAPDLHRGARIAHQRRDLLAASNAIRPVRRARGLARLELHL